MKHNKKWEYIVIIILLSILLIEMVFIQKNNTLPIFRYDTATKSEIKDELIIALFINNIESDSEKFYNKYFSDELEYFNYIFKIKDIKKQGEPLNIYITFETTPMIGPHIPVGDDEITYKVNASGNITLENFDHKKSYEIPSRLQHNMIRPYPEVKN